MLLADVELLVDAAMKADDLALDGCDVILEGGHLIANAVKASVHGGTQILHAVDDKLSELFDGVDFVSV